MIDATITINQIDDAIINETVCGGHDEFMDEIDVMFFWEFMDEDESGNKNYDDCMMIRKGVLLKEKLKHNFPSGFV